MPSVSFDPYGEVSAEADQPAIEPRSALQSAGLWIFWLSVIVVVIARAFYFSGFPQY